MRFKFGLQKTNIVLTLFLASTLTLTLGIQLIRTETKTIYVGSDNINTKGDPYESITSELGNASSNGTFDSADLFAFYYPWYGTPNVSGYWFHWNDATHNPDNFLDGRRDIPAKHYPLLDVYDSNDPSLIEKHIEIARMTNIDVFVVSWWGIDSFEDNALLHIKNVCEQMDFKFTIYYESTDGVSSTLNDILYLLNNYANSSSWYRIDDRPVIFVYSRARDQLYPRGWKTYGSNAHWSVFEDVRDPPRDGIFVIHPYSDGIGYVESYDIILPPNETYSLEVAISDMRNDCPPNSDVGFRIKIKNNTAANWEILDDLIVNFNDGWLDLSYDVSSYAGESVLIRVESYPGGVWEWCSEWAAVDYFFIKNSKDEIINQGPYFDNEWKTVVNSLNESGYNPYFIMDFGGHEAKVQDFAEYFLNFTDGIHTYIMLPSSMPDTYTSEVYNEASNAAHSKNKIFVATVVPGYDDTEVRSPGYVVDRQNGSYYKSFWSTAKSSFPDHYIITSFNEWHEGTEIEPSLEYQYLYINLTKAMSTTWTVDDDGPADFHTIQAAINAADPGDIIFVSPGTYYEHVVVNKTVSLVGENRDNTFIDGNGTGNVVYVTANNTTINGFTIQNGLRGIWLDYSQDNTLTANNIRLCDSRGVYLTGSKNNTLTNNTVSNINWAGIWIQGSSNNIVSGNVVTNTNYGIRFIGSSHNNTIEGNILSSNQIDGIHLNSNYNNIIGNNASNNGANGISIWAWYNNITGNLLSNNNIRIEDSNYNRIYHNNFYGVAIHWHGIVHHDNIWDDGYPSGGNYWSDYVDNDLYSGPYQNETGSDGIGDTPYFIDANNTDNYPLMNPWGSIFEFSHPETIAIYQAHLEVNTYFSRGYYLLTEFYSYNEIYQGSITVWYGTTPYDVFLSMDVTHHQDKPIEKVYLVLRDVNMTKIQTITSFTMYKFDLFKRLVYFDGEWGYVSPEERSAMMNEIADIDIQWIYAPS